MIRDMLLRGKAASKVMARMTTLEKNDLLAAIGASLEAHRDQIKEENRKDLEKGRASGLSEAMLDRLTLTDARIDGMIEGLGVIRDLKDPVGEIVSGFKTADDLRVAKVRVPIGLIAMIYESRPNVTVDAAALALKSGNAMILRGGKEAIHSNKALMAAIAAVDTLPEGAVQLVPSTDRELVRDLVTADDLLDVIIPRGGKGLKNAITSMATVPVIMTGMGLCHLYVDATADEDQALPIALNAKVQRPGVCNAIETLLVHEKIAPSFLPRVAQAMIAEGVTLTGCEKSRRYAGEVDMAAADEDTYDTEYLALGLSIKVVSSVEEAIAHIDRHGTKHSESILTRDVLAAEQFLNEVDASTVYVNASTRFTDGGVFGMGGEIGISTQKLHARGPMGLEALTTTKYQVRGNGQIRK
jgi:glutamate-5-semialdehyde dehydrogenase